MSNDSFRTFFLRYADSFTSPDAGIQGNVVLKKEHSLRVCAEITAIGSAHGLSRDDLRIAEIAALFHDIGRFEQYTRYKTFSDRNSIDHAELGLRILRDTGALLSLPPEERELVYSAIGFHNRAALPDGLPERTLLFCRLLRDADKLDILRILTDSYRNEKSTGKNAAEPDPPSTQGISSDAVADLMAGHIVFFSHVHNRDDFKILQLAWVFDLNFAFSCKKVRERTYLEAIRDALPDTETVREAYRFASGILHTRITGSA